MPQALHLAAIVSLIAAALCAGWIAWDERKHPQKMWIMNFVWPLCALFGHALVLGFYLWVGRQTPEGSDDGEGAESSYPVSVAKGALHCGSGCTLGDIIAEWVAFLVPAVAIAFGWQWLFSEKIFAVWVLDLLLAFCIGMAFQYFAIKPMRDVSRGEALWLAAKADVASLLSWQVGMYGFMAIAHFWLFPVVIGQELATNTFEFWFMMQIAMLCGFMTAYPVNWWLISAGIKERM